MSLIRLVMISADHTSGKEKYNKINLDLVGCVGIQSRWVDGGMAQM